MKTKQNTQTSKNNSIHLSMLLLMLVKYPHSFHWESQRTDDLNSLCLAKTKEKLVQKNHSRLGNTVKPCEQ